MNCIIHFKKTTKNFLFFIFMIALVAPCFAAEVHVKYKKDFDFGRVQTYAWEKGTPADDAWAEETIRKGVEAQLAKHGLKYSDSNPDVYIVTHATLLQDLQIVQWGSGSMLWGETTVDMDKLRTGSLAVEILNSNRQLVWRAVGTDSLTAKQEKDEGKINKGIQKMFEKFPPPSETNHE